MRTDELPDEFEGNGDPEYVCELHPWLGFYHDKCPGPGLPGAVLKDLHQHAQMIWNEDYEAFIRLLVAVRRAGVFEQETAALAELVPVDEELQDLLRDDS
jgi:hypothetical protein